MKKLVSIALLTLLSTGCGAQTAAVDAIRPTGKLAAKDNFKVEVLLTVAGTINGRIEKSNGEPGAIVVDTADGEKTVYLTEQTALAWDPRVKAIRAPLAKLDLKAGTKVEVLAVEEKNTGWGPSTWLRAKSVVIMVGA